MSKSKYVVYIKQNTQQVITMKEKAPLNLSR